MRKTTQPGSLGPGDGDRQARGGHGPLRLGTRGSALALSQAMWVARQVTEATGRPVELVRIKSEGDRDRTTPLDQLGGTGVFAQAVRLALREGRCDLVVHSMKDLPVANEPGLTVVVPRRAPANDVLCAAGGQSLADLPAGAKVGTGSPRRAAQLRSLRQDVEVVGLRGNVETRLARALGPDADLDAVVLAQAGLIRVGRADTVSEVFDVQRMAPAAGQGALAIEVRAQDAGTYQAAASLADRDATLAVSAERAVLGALGAGCAAPIGVFGQVIEAELVLFAAVASLDGRENALASQRVILGSSPENHLAVDLGRRVARALLAQGAAGLATLAPDGGLLAEDAAP